MTVLAQTAHLSLALCLALAACATSIERSATDERHILLVDDASAVEREVIARGGRVESHHIETGVMTVLGLDDDAATALGSLSAVRAIGRDEIVSLAPHETAAPRVAGTSTMNVSGSPGEATHLGRQWHLSAIGAEEVWEAGYIGSPRVTVAVLDTGIDYLHPDLAGRVDLERSVSFVPSDDALVANAFDGRHEVTDLHYHGTHVAATIASNAIAAAGVTSETRLIGVKVLGENGKGPLSGIVRGILHAVDSGADVINMSLGATWVRGGLDWYLGVVHVVLHHARAKGVTVIVSAGNDARDLDADPSLFDLFCESPLVICVSATGPTASEGDFGPYTDVDALAPYSNVGEPVDIAAPGGDAEPVWAACSSASVRLDCAKSGTIVGLSGTSMAAPHASGVAALLVELHGRSPDRVRLLLERTAVDRGEPGHDEKYGWGRIDAPRALGFHLPGGL